MSSTVEDHDIDRHVYVLKTSYGIALSEQSGRGRCVVATKDYSRGDIVLQEEPAEFVLFSSSLDYSCAYCAYSPQNGQIFGLNSEDPYRYCSASCISRDRELHNLERQALSRVRALGIEGSMDSCNLVMRIAAKRKILDSTIESPRFPLMGRYTYIICNCNTDS